MKKMLSVLFVVLSNIVYATDYYVGGAGASDSNLGTSSQPFATIQKAASVAIAGDVVKIRSGTYRETIVPANSGVTFQPDVGATVTISGLNVIDNTGWTVHTASIYKKTITLPVNGYNTSTTQNLYPTAIYANQIFKDGEMMFEARWPKVNSVADLFDRTKYRPLSHPTFATNNLTDSGLPVAAPGLVGATIVSNGWFVNEARTIAGHSGSQISWTNAIWDNTTTGSWTRRRYYITNKLTLLTQPKEWHYENGTLYFWQEGGGAPSGTIEYKARNWGFDVRGKSNTQIIGLIFIGCDPLVGDANSTNTTIDHIRATYMNHYVRHDVTEWQGVGMSKMFGIKLLGSNSVIKNSELYNSGSQGVWLGPNCRAENNLMHDIGYVGNWANPISLWGTDGGQVITRNTIYRTGRSSIDFGFNFGNAPGTSHHYNVEISYNDLSQWGLISQDAGATYAWGQCDLTGLNYHHNWIYNNGAPDRSDVGANVGIYFDQASGPGTIHHNVTWLCSAADIYHEVTNETRTGSGGWTNPNPAMNIYNNTFANVSGSAAHDNTPPYARSYITYEPAPFDVQKNNIYRSTIITNGGSNITNAITSTTDPLFVGPANTGLGYRLQSTSPAKDAGTAIPGITDGSIGNPDIGAYEYGGEAWVPGNNAPVGPFVPTTPPPGTNLALGKTATQSSTWNTCVASRAVDGSTNGNGEANISHTQNDAQGWWMVDLGAEYNIGEIKIWNRTDGGYQNRLSDYHVRVLNASQTEVWSNHQTTYPNPTTTLNAGGTSGRFVRIQLTGTNYLHLAEVEVYAGLPNLALGKTASQSSTWSTCVASRAVDGSTNGNGEANISHTQNDAQGWWMVDLGANYNISEIKIWNRTDGGYQSRLSDFYVRVLNASQTEVWSNHQTTYPNPTTTVNAGAVTGRYVKVQLTGTNFLHMAEVQVFGTSAADVTAPTAPANLASPSKTDTSVNLTWTASTDDLGVTGYEIYNGGTLLTSIAPVTSHNITGLLPNTSYSFTIKAKDAADNFSAASNTLNIATNPTGPTKYEAELATLAGGAAVNTNHANYSGTGFVDGYWNSGASVTISVNAPASGIRQVTLRYANAFTASSLSLYVNNVKVEQISLPSTSSWDTWSDKTSSVTLNAGVNTISYKYDAGDIAHVNLDYILVAAPSINLALGKTATQSSTWNTCVASRAVDGSTNGNGEINISHTQSNAQAWWMVDLGADYSIGEIKIWNRTDGGYQTRLGDFYVRVLNATQTEVWSDHQTTYPNPTTTVNARGVTGRYVRVQLTGTNFLHMAEVEVFGSSGDATAPTAPSNLASPSKTDTSVNLTWTASTDNVGVTAYEIYNGSTMITSIAPATSHNVTGLLPNTAYSFTIKAKDAANNLSAASNTLNVTTAALPPPWLSQDIGNVGVAGSATYALGTFTINGSGTDIWTTTDEFHFVYRPLNGDGEIVARVASLENVDSQSKAGVMIRETLAGGSKHALVNMAPIPQQQFLWRSTTDGTTAATVVGSTAAPYWVKLKRVGNAFSAFTSANGTSWTQLGTTQTVTMATSVYIGLAVLAKNNTTLNTSTFDNVLASDGSGNPLGRIAFDGIATEHVVTPLVESGDKLFQNTPNPFSVNTEIEVYLDQSARDATLVISDLNGKVLKNITLDKHGKFRISIIGNEFNTGLYLYTLFVNGNWVDTKRMVLTK